MVASTIFLTRDMNLSVIPAGSATGAVNLGLITGTFVVLMFTRIPAPFVALTCLALGWLI